MRLLFQFSVILGITFLGELLNQWLPLPIPASIYGLVILLGLLCAKVIKLEQVKDAADFLIEIMPPMFIPAAVGVIAVWPTLQKTLGLFVTIIVVSTVVVMACTGRVAQYLIRKKRAKEEETCARG